MNLNKAAFIIAFLFACGWIFAAPRWSLAVPPGGHPVFGPGWMPKGETVAAETYDEDAVDKDVYEEDQGPAWAREEHPSLKGLRRAYANVCRNQASVRAQNVLRALIEARSVNDSIYELEKATGDEETLDELTGDEEVREALVQEARRIREEARQQLHERKAFAWALKKIGRALEKLGDRLAAEETLVEAAAAAPEDRAVYEALNELYAQMGAAEMPVFVKGKKVKFDVPPQVVRGRTLVPLRKLAESLGCTVEWQAAERKVVLIQGAKVIVLGVGQNTATVDGREISLDVSPTIINGRVLVPLRFVSEAVDAQVEYLAESRMVVVN
jgi:hypothetical protein